VHRPFRGLLSVHSRYGLETAADEIIERMSNGESLVEICKDEHMPSRSAVYVWLDSKPAFKDRFARARETMADHHFDQMWSIARDDKADIFFDNAGDPHIDHARIQRHKLQIDVLKLCFGME
jgi:hypothetical protein